MAGLMPKLTVLVAGAMVVCCGMRAALRSAAVPAGSTEAGSGQGQAQDVPAAPKLAAVAPIPPVPKAAAEIFAQARPLYDFGSKEMKPWHMKVSYQIFETEGYPGEQGTYEYWWAAPDRYRSTWKRGTVEDSEWRAGEETFHKGSGSALNFYEWKLRSVLLDPLPKPEEVDSKSAKLDRRERPRGSVKMPCVMVVPKMPHGAESRKDWPTGLFPTYCFEPSRIMLRAYLAYGGTSVLYQQLVRVQGKFLPKELTISEGANRLMTAGLDGVNGIAADAPELKPEEGATASKAAGAIRIEAGVSNGSLLTKTNPVYPQEAKAARQQGRVVLRATIGKDGHIHELGLVEAPAPSLAEAAMECVMHWVYKPYSINGEPVEVDTTINVEFKLGP